MKITDTVDQHVSWYVWFTELSIVPDEYRYVLRLISWFFITLALTPIVPIILLVIYDFALWLCQHRPKTADRIPTAS
ncbi:hypothetical protein B0T25DRAFT_239600 [Lasiosphaeria hispida]|uniref:Uncharacterized protein n=1 Tax=Lasiosphaeria hispida TaxID=260671 RepID=A0AAJ0MCL3_9PEZI|nr:hypothetical protein B0T25DRAFT_239600 [Lasiosphaeria hispida]